MLLSLNKIIIMFTVLLLMSLSCIASPLSLLLLVLLLQGDRGGRSVEKWGRLKCSDLVQLLLLPSRVFSLSRCSWYSWPMRESERERESSSNSIIWNAPVALRHYWPMKFTSAGYAHHWQTASRDELPSGLLVCTLQIWRM